jgi:hypothetical protein
MYFWMVFLHVLCVLAFLMAHGVSASVFFALRNERNVERIRSLLQLSGSSLLGTRVLNEVRQGVGLPSAYGEPPRPEPFSAEELDTRLKRLQPMRLALAGFGGLALIAWLMMFKPF